jgi:DNA-directed RNA polymerase subunit beta
MSQAVPLIKNESPIVGTGIEDQLALNTNALLVAEDDGEIEYADSKKVIVKYKKEGKATYYPKKFEQTNYKTCFNQYVKVKPGQKVKKGDIIIEGPCVVDGDLSIGTNLKVAYMMYKSLEFEDGIVISDALVKNDLLTSIHINNYNLSVVETKLGPEEITRDIPNVSEDALRNLDEDGIVVVGSRVKAGDILVGKIASKGDVDLTAEERLLRAIFGEKAKDVRDNSLYMPHGQHGVVIGVKRGTKEQNESLPAGMLEEITVYVAQQKKIEVGDKLAGRHGNKGVISAIISEVDMPLLEDGTPVQVIISSEAALRRMNVGQILESSLGTAGKILGKKYAIPSLQEIPEELIAAELKAANMPVSGKLKLIDGETGTYFDNEVVVGESYICKLIHMSEEKMHARSTGPYSLITQQPLGGKAQFGGQRFGEMEVWALEAYGAAHTLKEILTIKSDDMIGRTQAYSAIVQGHEIPESTTPETFKLLIRKINGLGLGFEPISYQDDSEEESEVETLETLGSINAEKEVQVYEADNTELTEINPEEKEEVESL